MTTVEDLSAEELRRLYLDEGKTEAEIASLFGTYQVKVGRLRRQWGIPTLIKSDRLDLPHELTPRLRSILIGSMLGDGGLRKTGASTAGYVEHHSIGQRPYLDWKAQEWGSFVARIIPSDKGEHLGFRLLTHGCRVLYPYWEMFYPTGKGDKTYLNMPLDLVDDLALAVWFMDDGSKGKDSFRFSIGPSELDREVKFKTLRRLGLRALYYNSGTEHSLHIQDRTQVTKFLDLVRPHLHPSLAYKVQITPRKLGSAPRESLTPEKLQPLVERGFTAQAIAGIFRVSPQSVCRALDRMGVQRHVGRPARGSRKEMTVASASLAIQNLDPTSSKYPAEVLGILSQTEIPLGIPSEDETKKDWQSLLTASTSFDGTTFVRLSKNGSKICQRFFPYRWDARYRNNPSVREAWHDPKALARAIRFQMVVNDPLTPTRVFRALQAVVRAPTNFRPCLAKATVEAFCPPGGLVLDPCAGYGGRATGTLAAGRKYVGVDPHPSAGLAYQALSALIGPLTFHNLPFEDLVVPEDSADLVFTSPPYFTVERYSDEPTQSWVRYPTWQAWLDGFLEPLIVGSWKALKPGGAFVVNTKNVRQGRHVYPIAESLQRSALTLGFKLEKLVQLPLGYLGKTRTEPLLIFRKP